MDPGVPIKNHGDSDEPVRKKNNSMIVTLAKEFADLTLMHGIHFISNEKTSLPEK